MDEERISRIEIDIATMRHEQKAMKEELDEVKNNSSEMIDLLKGGKVATKVFLWFVGIVAGLGVILEFWGRK